MQPQSQDNSSPLQSTEKESIFAPLHKVTLVSKVLAAVVFIILPFVGFWMGIVYEKHKTESGTVYEAPLITMATSTSSKPVSLAEEVQLVSNGVIIYSVEDGRVRGENRSYPILSLYKKSPDGIPTKFSSVGALGEYPIFIAVSNDRNKVAVNLESKLILIDVETGRQETIYTPKFVVGGQIAFSPDSSKLAFVDGNYYVSTEYVTLYVYNIVDKKLTEQAKSPNITYVDVNHWRSDDVLVLSATVPKGCAQPVYSLFDLNSKSLAEVEGAVLPNGFMSRSYVIKRLDAFVPEACKPEVGRNMCGDLAYSHTNVMSVVDPVTGVVIGNFGEGSQSVEYIGISPQADKVLYSESPLPGTVDQCNDNSTGGKVYKLKDLKSGEINVVTNLRDQLKLWGITLQDKNDPSYIPGNVITPSIGLEMIN